MIDWEFNPEDYNPNGNFQLIPPGKYRVRIEDAEEKISKSSGNDMIKLTLKVSGYKSKVWYYLIFDPKNREFTNQRLGELWNSFNIPAGNFNLQFWKGKVGGANIKHRPDNNDNMQASVSYFLKREEVEKLPAWQETETTATQEPSSNINPNMVDFGGNDPVPF